MVEKFLIQKEYIYAIVVISILIIGGFLFLNGDKLDTQTTVNQNTPAPIQIEEKQLDLTKEIKLQTTEGENISLSQFKGNVVILQAMASWCSSCKLQAIRIKPVYDKYKNDGLVVISMDIQPERSSLDSLKKFKATYGGDWYFGFYPEFIMQYSILSLDSTIIIDKKGNIAYRDHGVTDTEKLENVIVELLDA